MQREIQLTADGSHTVFIPELDLSYHSWHGALAESTHVFIEAGLLHCIDQSKKNSIHILEIGFGTGLNALLSLREAIRYEQKIKYVSVEPFPLLPEEFGRLNHGELLSMQKEFLQLHTSAWEEEIEINSFFTLLKTKQSIPELKNIAAVDCIYFDAFSPTEQPELWTEPIFKNLYELLSPGGILVTYSSKTEIRKSMNTAGFSIEKTPGPYGKREMVRATK